MALECNRIWCGVASCGCGSLCVCLGVCVCMYVGGGQEAPSDAATLQSTLRDLN